MAGLLKGLCIAACMAALAAPVAVRAQALAGSPPVVRLPITLDVYQQNFDLAQDAESLLYVANAEGVMIYDGSRWTLLKLPNQDLARSLLFDGGTRVYVGGYDVFGYIERDAAGEETYHDLTPLFTGLLKGEPFADIWDIHRSKRGVFFRALNHAFLYQPESGQVQLWRHEGRFGAITEYEGDTLLQFRGQGLKRLNGNDWELLPGSEPLSDLVYQLLPLPDGGLLALAGDGRWRSFRKGVVSGYSMPPGMPPSSLFSRGLRMADGGLVLVGSEGSVVLFDPLRRLVRQFKVDEGSLSGLIAAQDGGLLTAGDDAAYHITWPSPWTVTGRGQGLGGSLYGLNSWGSDWFVLTGNGVYQALAGGGFRRMDWTGHEAWELLPLDEGSALLAESYQLKLVRKGQPGFEVTGADDLYPRLLRISPRNRDVVYVGTESGLAVLQRQGRRWRLRLQPEPSKPLRINSLVEIAPHELWLGTERDGVLWLKLAEDNSRVVESRSYGAEQGLAFGAIRGGEVVLRADRGLLVTTEAGIFRWDAGRFVAEPLDGLDQLRAMDERLTLVQSPKAEDWAYSDTHIYRRNAESGWQRQELGGILQGAIQDAAFEAGGATLFAASGTILRYGAGLATPLHRQPSLLLRAVERTGPRNQRERLPQRSATPLQFLEDSALGLSFRFSLPELRRRDSTRYQARLAGLNESFSEWSESTTYNFRRLDAGKYRFEARARDALGQISELAPYEFIIEPRWHATPWGRALLLMAALALIGVINLLLVRLRTRRLHADKQKLEQMVALRTRELESANRQLQALAHLDGLTEIPNRRRLDDYLSEVWQQCVGQQRSMSVLVVDVDNFKTFNDREGHLAGDTLLKQLAEGLSGSLRRSEDLVARYGGDEFVVVMPGASAGAAKKVAEQMRKCVEDARLGITISIGIATRSPRPDEPVSSLVHEADEALYEAKRRGRNRAVVYTMPGA